MTYVSAQPMATESWDDICYPVEPVWLSELLPDYDIMATDRQQLIVGQMPGGRKTLFGIQSAEYTIIPNESIRQVIDELIPEYRMLAKYTTTGEFSISIVLPATLSVGQERLERSLILTNSYNGRTPFSIQGQTLTSLLSTTAAPGSSFFRPLCQNGLLGWADSFSDSRAYRNWLADWSKGKEKIPGTKGAPTGKAAVRSSTEIRKIHHRALTIERFQEHLRTLLLEHLSAPPTLTASVYSHFQETPLPVAREGVLQKLPIPVQLAKQAMERMRLEERMLNSSGSYWLLYNAVNYALFSARSSLTLNDRYRLDERVFHQLAADTYA
jgi:hypothetical protein